MSEKINYQKPIIDWLKTHHVDFLHIGNSAFGGNSRNYNTTAFRDTPVIGEDIRCDKYFPDLMIGWGGSVWLVEFGIKGSHKERKAKQEERMSYWRDVAGAKCFIVMDTDSVNGLIESLEAAEKPHYLT